MTGAELTQAREKARRDGAHTIYRRAREQARRDVEHWGRSMTCAGKPREQHGTCMGLRAHMNDGLGCLCECHDPAVNGD